MALDASKLEEDIKHAIDTYLPYAIEIGLGSGLSAKNKQVTDHIEKTAQLITKHFSPWFSKELAQAIDSYIKNANIHGSVMLTTVGAPSPHTAFINVESEPVGKGGGIPFAGGANNLKLGIT